MTCDNACHGHYGTSMWSRSMYEPSTHCDYSSMKRWSPAARASRIYSSQALTPSWRRLTTENWNIIIQENRFKNVVSKNTRQPNLFTNTLCLTHWSRDILAALEMHFVERNYHVGSESGSATNRRQAIIGSKNRLINRLNRVFMHP